MPKNAARLAAGAEEGVALIGAHDRHAHDPPPRRLAPAFRDGEVLKAVLPETARHFARAIVMPNLVPPVVTGRDAAEYRDRILSAKPHGSKFRPLMTLYLTEETEVRDLRAAAEIGLITAVKLYPPGPRRIRPRA
jgi:dihydroorotase